MNTEVMFSSATVNWSTPQQFFDRYNQKYQFTLDVCALPENAKCPVYFTPDDDGLKQTWEGVAWMNPPYGREIPKWIEKAFQEANCTKKNSAPFPSMVVVFKPCPDPSIQYCKSGKS